MSDQARVTQQYVEVAISEDSEPRSARVTQQYVEVAALVFEAFDLETINEITAPFYGIFAEGLETVNETDPATFLFISLFPQTLETFNEIEQGRFEYAYPLGLATANQIQGARFQLRSLPLETRNTISRAEILDGPYGLGLQTRNEVLIARFEVVGKTRVQIFIL